MPTVGLAIIARDEQDDLPQLLASVEGHFDQVALLDTGSKDDTVGVFLRWADTMHQRHRVGRFEWCDDFTAARRAADELLDTEWTCWADCDDVILNAQRLREYAAAAPPELAGFICGYDYAQDPQTGTCVCFLKRERLVRAGMGVWAGRVHEAQLMQGPVQEIPDVVWKHCKRPERSARSGGRNLRILRSWIKDEPDNARVLAYLGRENMVRGHLSKAEGHFRRYLRLKTGWDEERAQVHRHLSQVLMARGRHSDAVECALAALAVMPSWPDSYLTLAEAHYSLGEFPKAAEWAREVLRRGQPNTLLIINPLDYTFQARLVLAGALGALGQTQDALDVAHEALALVPHHEDLVRHAVGWRAALKRDQTAQTWASMYRVLVEHDEQLKARDILGCVPHYADNHPLIVGARAEIAQRLAWLDGDYVEHYTTGGSKPEDFVGDERLEDVCNSLSRTHFALEGILEQCS